MKPLTNYPAIIVDLDGTLYYQKPVRIAMLKEMVLHFWRFRDFLMSALVIFVESSAFDIAFGDVFNGELGWGFLPEDVHSFCDMETDVAAKIGSYHFGAGAFMPRRRVRNYSSTTCGTA